jgi:hypothetical protein
MIGPLVLRFAQKGAMSWNDLDRFVTMFDTHCFDVSVIKEGSRPTMSITEQRKIPIALTRPLGYEDVRPDLVAVDALDTERPWPHEFVRDTDPEVVIELYRPEGYERTAAHSVAAEAIRPDWSMYWRLLN